MCKAQKKLKVFSYILGKFVELQKEKIPDYRDKPESEILETFSNTRIMKLLYCLCLESLYDPKGGINERNLFSILGAFTAFPNGPVVLDIYNALDIVPGFKYENGHFTTKTSNQTIELSREDTDLIDNAIIRLKNRMSSDYFISRNKLIKLTHNLPIWIQTYIYNTNKEMTLDSAALNEEYTTYKNILS